MKRIVGLREVADQLNLFLVDQYGIPHDGPAAHSGAIDVLARTASRGRRTIAAYTLAAGQQDAAFLIFAGPDAREVTIEAGEGTDCHRITSAPDLASRATSLDRGPPFKVSPIQRSPNPFFTAAIAHHCGAAATPESNSRSMASSGYPAALRISRLCSPSRGAGRPISVLLIEN